MLRVLGGPKRLCSGITRRDLLTVGSLGLAGLHGLSNLDPSHWARAAGPADLPGFGSAKNVIVLYLFGGPSHLEMCDMKPEAPAEVRGELKPIASTLPGCDVCEYLPQTARVMDRCTVVRSLTHPWNFHGMQYATTGLAVGSIPVEETLVHPQHQPYLGSVIHYLRDREAAASGTTSVADKPPGAAPDNIVLPFMLSSRRPAARYTPPYGAFLGSAYDPIFTEFRGEATRSMLRRSFGAPAEIADPYLGIKPDGRFLIVPQAQLPSDVTIDRLHARRSLLEQMEIARREADRVPRSMRLDQQRHLAMSLLDSPKVREALALEQESDKVRESYGMTLFGQATLQARRLVEAGCRFVTVVWDEYGQLNAGWDTHVDHYNRLKKDLLPGFDPAFATLVRELDERGLLDETLVCVMNEMGRTPRFEGDGRGHWGRAYTNFFTGAGLKRGAIVGRTDRLGAAVADRPLTAKDILATIYHLVGIDPHTALYDRQNRPVPLVHDGQVVREMLA